MSETIKLDYPVQLADRLLEEISMRRIIVDDLIACPIKDGQDYAGEVKLAARISKLKEDELRLLDIVDYTKCQKVLFRFRFGDANTKTDNEDNDSDA